MKLRTIFVIAATWGAFCLACTSEQAGVPEVGSGSQDRSDSLEATAWYRHVEDNSRFIEKARQDEGPSDSVPEIIYTDTWSGEGKFVLDLAEPSSGDSAP